MSGGGGFRRPGTSLLAVLGSDEEQRLGDGRGESKGEGRRLCTEGGVSRDVGMRTKITGTACDVSSSRLVWVWVWVWGMGMGMGMVVFLVCWEWLAGTGLAGRAGLDWLIRCCNDMICPLLSAWGGGLTCT